MKNMTAEQITAIVNAVVTAVMADNGTATTNPLPKAKVIGFTPKAKALDTKQFGYVKEQHAKAPFHMTHVGRVTLNPRVKDGNPVASKSGGNYGYTVEPTTVRIADKLYKASGYVTIKGGTSTGLYNCAVNLDMGHMKTYAVQKPGAKIAYVANGSRTVGGRDCKVNLQFRAI